MSIWDEYRSKLCTPKQAVQLVRSGDWVDYGSNNSMPFSLDAALAERRDELHAVKIRGNLTPGPIRVIECDPEMEHFIYNTWHCGVYERKMCDEGRAFFSPMLFRNLEWYYRNFLTVNVAMLSVAPMDEDGFFSLSGAAGALTGPVAVAEKIVLEVNEAMPRIPGGPETKIHVSRADAIVEVGKRPLWQMVLPQPTETDSKIAAQLIPHITDGTTLQLGIGGMPNALGELLADSDIRDLGMHTELCSDGYLALEKAGKLTNRCKKSDPGIGILGLAIGTQDLYDWIHENPGLRIEPLRIVNAPPVIAGLDRVISINSCLNVDLYGQVSSESVGTRQISGTGGQLDFVTGASDAEHGKSFLCMSSSFTDRSGTRHSRILPSLSGDIVTTPRSQAYWIVTEYGAVNLAGKTTWERAEALISIAHPDFREELIRAAEKQHIWLASNRR